MKWLYKILSEKYAAQVEIQRCKTCEVLERQLELERYEKRQLLDRIINPPAVQVAIEREPVKVTVPKNVPWKVRQGILEAEDRERARLMSKAAIDNGTSLEELEKEMGVVAAERENAG